MIYFFVLRGSFSKCFYKLIEIDRMSKVMVT